MMCDQGFATQLVLVIDAKAMEYPLHRQGSDRKKHMELAHLWLQDEVKSDRLKVLRVKSEQHCGRLAHQDTQSGGDPEACKKKKPSETSTCRAASGIEDAASQTAVERQQ